MLEPTSDKHYETAFEFTLWKLIKKRPDEKDISYVEASPWFRGSRFITTYLR
jgi:hypothetical protein